MEKGYPRQGFIEQVRVGVNGCPCYSIPVTDLVTGFKLNGIKFLILFEAHG